MKYINFLLDEFKKEKELVRSSLVMLIATGSSALITFIVDFILAKIFGPESFGNFRTVFYLISFFCAMIDFGAAVTLTKYIAQFRVQDRKKIGHMSRWFLKLRLISFSVLFAVLVVFINPITIYFLHDPSLSYLIVFGFSIVIGNVFATFLSMVLGYENFNLYLISRLVTAFGYIILGIGLGYFFGVAYAILGLGLSNLLGYLVCLKLLFKEKSFEKKDGAFDIKEIFFKFSIPMHIFNLPSYFGNAIVPLLSLFFSMRLIGQYSFSFLFYYAGLVIPGTLASVLLPKLSRLNALKENKKIKETLMKVFLAYTFFVFCSISGVLLFGRIILSIISPEYLPGIIFFKALICLGLLTGYLVIFNSYLTAKERIKEVALSILLQNILLFLVSFILFKFV